MLHAVGKDFPSEGRYFNRTVVGLGLWIISTASELFSVAGSSDLTEFRCFFGQLGGSGVLRMQRDVSGYGPFSVFPAALPLPAQVGGVGRAAQRRRGELDPAAGMLAARSSHRTARGLG